jgi:fluoride exporter
MALSISAMMENSRYLAPAFPSQASAAKPRGMKSLLYVMIGGGFGAVLRYGASRALPEADGGWPWPTFAVNVAGGFVMGLLAVWLLRAGDDGEPLRLLLGVGLLGGFTTFSAFSLEMAQMAERGQVMLAAGYALASVVLALAALFAGLALGRAVLA